MNAFRSIPGLALLASALAVPLAAQGPEEHGGHGERLGHVRFATSCRGAARREVEHGVAYLHSFWYEKATETFTAAAVVDSSCAMAFWGQAMSLLHPLWTPPSSADAKAALAAIDRGVAAARTARERDYLGAIRAYYVDFDRTDPKTRLDRYALAMDTVQRHSPSDREAAIFYALALIAVGQANATDTTFAYQKRADSILEPLFRREPRHPGLAHYLIHTNDVPQLAAHGLDAARRYAEIAPDVPHAQHMPSHIFTRLGAWDDAIAAARGNDSAAARQELLELARIDSALRASGGPQAYWAGQVAIQLLAAKAWLDLVMGDTAAAILHARQAADREDGTQKHPVTPGPVLPARELEGDLLFAVGKPAEAAQAYKATLALSPNRARSLFGLARAAELTGDMATARAKYREFLDLMAKGDGARPEVAIARRGVPSR